MLSQCLKDSFKLCAAPTILLTVCSDLDVRTAIATLTTPLFSLGSSGLINGALTIIAACVPLQKRPAYLGFMMSFGQLGIAFGPLIGGALTQYTTWRWCFYINLPIGAVAAAILLLIRIPDRTADTRDVSLPTIFREKLDLLGFAIFAPAAIQFLLALQWGGTKYRWDSATTIGLFFF